MGVGSGLLSIHTLGATIGASTAILTRTPERNSFLNPRIKKNFKGRLDRDIKEYCDLGLPKIPVYLSSNCEPFQPLEEEHRHSLYALQRLTGRNSR